MRYRGRDAAGAGGASRAGFRDRRAARSRSGSNGEPRPSGAHGRQAADDLRVVEELAGHVPVGFPLPDRWPAQLYRAIEIAGLDVQVRQLDAEEPRPQAMAVLLRHLDPLLQDRAHLSPPPRVEKSPRAEKLAEEVVERVPGLLGERDP